MNVSSDHSFQRADAAYLSSYKHVMGSEAVQVGK